MKYLSVPRLQKLSAMMQSVDVGDRIVHARVEAYSCKLAGSDKRAAKEITQAVDSELCDHPPSAAHASHLTCSLSVSPLGDLHESSTKQLLVSLITTLNASYPDYDYSGLRAEDFEREQSVQAAINAIDHLFVSSLEVALGATGFRDELWSALEETVLLRECEIYKYEPAADCDESAGKLWALHVFFYHRKLKKMVLLSGEAVSKLHLQNAHAQAYMHHARSRLYAGQGAASSSGGAANRMDDDDHLSSSSDSDSSDSDHDEEGGDGTVSDHRRAQAAEDDAMEAAEDEMLAELAAERGEAPSKPSGEIAGSWEQPLDPSATSLPQVDVAPLLPPAYDSSPSLSSTTSSVATVRVAPLSDAPPTHSAVHSPHAQQVRLASTRSPSMRPVVGRGSQSNPIVIGGASSPATAMRGVGGTPAQGVSLFGGARSSFSVPSTTTQATAALPAVPMFSS